jgi:hypothetical protein
MEAVFPLSLHLGKDNCNREQYHKKSSSGNGQALQVLNDIVILCLKVHFLGLALLGLCLPLVRNAYWLGRGRRSAAGSA